MFLKNYTSNAPVSQTIYRIEQVLIKCGVSGINKEYLAGGKVSAITFSIELEHNRPMDVRIPVNEQKALEVLWNNYKKTSPNGTKSKTDFVEQAKRTAWKIVQEWVEIQMSMVQMEQAEFREVFLPYFWDGKKTFFAAVKDSGFRALLPEKTE